MNNKYLDKKIREKLSENLEVPDYLSWNKVESGIERPRKKDRRFSYIMFLIFLLIFPLALIYQFSGFIEEKIESKIDIDNVKDHNTIENREYSIFNNRNKSELHDNLNIDDYLISSFGQQATVNTNKNSIISANRPTDYSLVSPININTTSELHSSHDGVENINNVENTSKYDQSFSDFRIESKVNKDVEAIPLIKVISIKPVLPLDSLIALPSFNNTSDIRLSKTDDFQLLIGFNVGSNIIKTNIETFEKKNNSGFSDLFSNRNGFSFEFNAQYQFSSGLSLLGGIRYVYARDRLEVILQDTLRESFPGNYSTLVVNEFSGNTHLIGNSRVVKKLQKRDIGFTNIFKTIEIPVALGYNFNIHKNLSLEVNSGIGLAYLSIDQKFIDSNFELVELNSNESSQLAHLSMFSEHGFKMYFQLNEKLSLHSGITYKRYLSDWHKSDESFMRPSALGANIGIQMRIKN